MYLLSSCACVRVYVCVHPGEFNVFSSLILSVCTLFCLHLYFFVLLLVFVLCSVTNVGLFVVVRESVLMLDKYRASPPSESSLVHSATPTSPIPTLAGQDECSEPEQRGGCLLHPDWRPGSGHAGGTGGVLLQIQDRVAPNEGVHGTSRCCLSCSGLSLLSLRQWC